MYLAHLHYFSIKKSEFVHYSQWCGERDFKDIFPIYFKGEGGCIMGGMFVLSCNS